MVQKTPETCVRATPQARLDLEHRGRMHDLRNALAVAGGLCELALSQLPTRAGGTEELTQAIKAIHQAARLATPSRSSEDAITVDPAAETVLLVRQLAMAGPPSVDFTTHTSRCPSLGIAATDYRRILENLCHNALHALHGKEGAVAVAVRPLVVLAGQAHDAGPPGRYLHLTVADTGPGIEPSRLPGLFRPGSRCSQSHGEGLGLWIVGQIVESAGGRLNVTSPPGVGARFDIYLPALDDPAD